MSDPQASAPKAWTHTPSRLTIFWLLLSVPLVAWDFGFILLRPHSMPGGWLHDPLWLPYAQYVKIDHTYGMEAYEAREGFPVALAVVNIFETLAYVTYLWIVYRYGGRFAVGVGRGASGGMGWLGKGVEVGGVPGGLAVLIGYATAVITLSKTVLFALSEVFSGFKGIGHNTFSDLMTMWVIPNSLWMIFPCYMIYVFGAEIMQGLAISGEKRVKSQ